MIVIDRDSRLPIYIQVSNELAKLIREGKITPGTFLPGTREMAAELSIHRKTIINAYDELTAQGWIASIPRKGFRVVPDLPVIKPRTFRPKSNFPAQPAIPEDLLQLPLLIRPGAATDYKAGAIIVNDGFPDTGPTPYDAFLQQYRQQLNNGILHQLSNQKEEGGLLQLRSSTAAFLNHSRA